MNADELDYELPPERIAQQPAPHRDQSRLLVLDRSSESLQHRHFADLADLLVAGDVLVFNNTRVLPARFDMQRGTGGRIEALFLAEIDRQHWEVLLRPSKRLHEGEVLFTHSASLALTLDESLGGGRWRLRVPGDEPASDVLRRIGRAPLPPYIRRTAAGEQPQEQNDLARYQTVYAQIDGSVAAPTAGLHFTPQLLEALQTKGVQSASLTLHVGAGTFRPITTARLDDHAMHQEWYTLSPESAAIIRRVRENGGRIVAVGTTTVRALESCATEDHPLQARTGWTNIFIRPPYTFRAVDALITNFHLPRSTLLAMVFAFAGRTRTLRAYEEAIRREYRFYSFGDAMLIL